jgi:hypothetical protein
MKSFSRIVFVVAVAGAIYFSTIGRKNFYYIVDSVNDLVAAYGANYTKK